METGCRVRKVLVAAAAAAAAASVQAQLAPWSAELAAMHRDGKPAVGLQPGRWQVAIGCGASLLPCRDAQAAQHAASRTGLRWKMELGTVRLPPPVTARTSLAPLRQGLNLSLVGRQPLFGSNFSLYGRLGTTSGFAESGGTAALAPDSSHGVSFGAGISYEVTPQLSATFGWDAYEMRLGGGPRDSVRATSLGLQYRY